LAIAAAEKHVLMASLCDNLMKMLKFKPRNVETAAIKVQVKTGHFAEKFSNLLFACFDSFSAGISLWFLFSETCNGNHLLLNGQTQSLILSFSRKNERI